MPFVQADMHFQRRDLLYPGVRWDTEYRPQAGGEEGGSRQQIDANAGHLFPSAEHVTKRSTELTPEPPRPSAATGGRGAKLLEQLINRHMIIKNEF
jgi:hypothetical protein